MQIIDWNILHERFSNSNKTKFFNSSFSGLVFFDQLVRLEIKMEKIKFNSSNEKKKQNILTGKNKCLEIFPGGYRKQRKKVLFRRYKKKRWKKSPGVCSQTFISDGGGKPDARAPWHFAASMAYNPPLLLRSISLFWSLQPSRVPRLTGVYEPPTSHHPPLRNSCLPRSSQLKIIPHPHSILLRYVLRAFQAFFGPPIISKLFVACCKYRRQKTPLFAFTCSSKY